MVMLGLLALLLSPTMGSGGDSTGGSGSDVHFYMPDPATLRVQRERDRNASSEWAASTVDSLPSFANLAVVVNPNPRPGRLANQLICYAQGQLYADTLGINFAKPVFVPVRTKSRTPFGPHMFLLNRTAVNMSSLLKVPTVGSPGLTGPNSDFFHQHYDNFRGLRERVRLMLEPGPFLSNDDVPLKSEVVVHIRMWEGFGCGNDANGCPGNKICQKSWPLAFGYAPDRDAKKCGYYAPHPPVNFFRDVVRGRHQTGVQPWTKMWIVAEPRARKSPYLRAILASLEDEPLLPSVELRAPNEAHVDFTFLTKANNLILTYGTYSWLAALISRASEVHVPFTRGAYEGLWYPAPNLLVDDAPEYVYHDVEEGGQGFLSAAMLTAQDTTYARAWKGRWRIKPRIIDRREAWASSKTDQIEAAKPRPPWLSTFLLKDSRPHDEP